MLSRMRTGGMTSPISAASWRRTAAIALEQIAALAVSTSGTRA
jgi:hypothetical protein